MVTRKLREFLSEEDVLSHRKITTKISVGIALLGISFTVFALTLNLRPDLLKDEFLALQLVLAIPFLISSTLARVKMVHRIAESRWEIFGFGTFVLAYGFLINSIGILLSTIVSFTVTLLFFVINIISALVYSFIGISYDRTKLKERLLKDLIFVVIVIFLGIFPTLGLY